MPINSGLLTSLLLPHFSSPITDSVPSLNLSCHSKNWCSIHARCSKSSLKHSICFCGIFSKFKTDFYRSSKVSWRPACIFEIHQLWQSGFSRVYSNWCCSCSFEPEIIKIGQSSHEMYSNNILNFQDSTTILNACTKKSLETSWIHHVYIYIYIYIHTHIYAYIYVYIHTFMHIYMYIHSIYIYIYVHIYIYIYIYIPMTLDESLSYFIYIYIK